MPPDYDPTWNPLFNWVESEPEPEPTYSTARLPYITGWYGTRSFPDKEDVNDVAENTDVRFQTYGVGRRQVPIILGTDRTGGLMSMIRADGGKLYLRILWAIGPVSSCTIKNTDGTDLDEDIVVTTYLGTTNPVVQKVDPTLLAIEPGYTDDLLVSREGKSFGICYSVFEIPSGIYGGWPRFIAHIDGLTTVWDPRLSGGAGGYAFTKTAGLILNWLLTDDLHGMGKVSDDTSLDALADVNEQVLTDGDYSEARNEIGITISKRSDIVKYIEALRGLARCYLVNRGGTYHYVPDRPRTADGTIASAKVLPKSIKPTPLDIRNAPNVVVVMYTNTAGDQWRDDMVEIAAPEVISGAERRRELVLNMPQIQSRPMAKRMGIERLNKARLTKFTTTMGVLDHGVEIEEGDVWNFNEPELAGAQAIRITSKILRTEGQYTLLGDVYDEDMYSDEIVDNDEFVWPPDSDNPFGPPAITGLTVVNVPAKLTTGKWAIYLQIDWDAVDYAYLKEYQVQVKRVSPTGDGDALIHTYRVDNNGVLTGDVVWGELYRIEVAVVSNAFALGPITWLLHIPSPNLLPPNWDEFGEIEAYEVEREVHLKVIVPPPDLDLMGFEWRYLGWEEVGDTPGNIIESGYNFTSAKVSADWAFDSGAGGSSTITANAAGNLVITAGASGVGTFLSFKNTNISAFNTLVAARGPFYVRAFMRIVSVTAPTLGQDWVLDFGDYDFPTSPNGAGTAWTVTLGGVGEIEGQLLYPYQTSDSIQFWKFEIESLTSDSLNGLVIELEALLIFADDQDWDRSLFIDRTPNWNAVTDPLDPGGYRFLCKGYDSVRSVFTPYGQLSENTLGISQGVTDDSTAHFLGKMDVGLPMTLETNAHYFRLGRDGKTHYWVPDSGDAADTLFTADPVSSGSYDNPACSYGLGSTAMDLISSVYSFEADVSGVVKRVVAIKQFYQYGFPAIWRVNTQYSLAATPTTWVNEPLTEASARGQNFRLRYQTEGGEYVRVAKPNMKMYLDATPRKELHEGTSEVSGATTINLNGIYTFTNDISVEILDSSSIPYTNKVDNLVMGDPSSFDLYFYRTDTDAQVAIDYRVTFEGI